jgi:hypothetical protein
MICDGSKGFEHKPDYSFINQTGQFDGRLHVCPLLGREPRLRTQNPVKLGSAKCFTGIAGRAITPRTGSSLKWQTTWTMTLKGATRHLDTGHYRLLSGIWWLPGTQQMRFRKSRAQTDEKATCSTA